MFLKFRRQMRLYLHQYMGLVIVTVLLITACQSGVPNSPNLENVRSLSIDCRVVEHAGGETTICGKPQKVVALEPKLLSMMLALDFQPSGYADAGLFNLRQFNNPSKQIPYLGNFVTSQPINLGDRSNPSLETLILLKPDLILGMKWQQNKLLSAIAPTVLIDNTEETWQDNIRILAKTLHREDNVQQVIASHKQHLAEVRTKLAPLVNTHPRVLNIACNQSMDYIEIKYSGDSVQLLEEIGFQSVLLEDVERKPGVRPKVTIETLSQLNADIIIVHTWLDHWDGHSTYNVPLEALKEKWAKNPLLHDSRAWKEGRVYFVDYHAWGGVIGGFIADSLMLEQLPTLLLSPMQGNSKPIFRAAINLINLFDVNYFDNTSSQLGVIPGEPFSVGGTVS
ncbi:iron-siderophore ABC transporter substrate-binding protein [Nostoc edaphicum CCNP1411]|uniref:Iron-siderophore ABC transporter substrate-binding protein n=1 Tax=Nostoc edaphicum CCNP1411 TaxID=1472755 RepID=A0A7D7LJ03_9NOSO|nr:iron-siderophore ABC transporter substrate-binding protein [Nostoc edaphicum]QMS92052.1 iron-siderophore ABC transporter substrate-binding protein [Nostoc edaphicum CCNP1411]